MNDIFKKIDHADILARRIGNEINSENFDNAFYLTDTFIFLFSGHQIATNKLITSYTSTAEELFNDGRIDEAESLVLKALLLAPENSQLLSIFVKIKNVQHQELRKLERPTAKKIVYEFIKRHFPEELSLFDTAWRVFKNIRPEDFKELAVSEALGIVGQESSELKTPKVIILLNQIKDKDIKTIQNENDKEEFSKAGRVIGCSQDLIEKVIAFILKG